MHEATTSGFLMKAVTECIVGGGISHRASVRLTFGRNRQLNMCASIEC